MRPNQEQKRQMMKQKRRMMFDDVIEIPEEKYCDAMSVRKFTHDDSALNGSIYLPHAVTRLDGSPGLPFI